MAKLGGFGGEGFGDPLGGGGGLHLVRAIAVASQTVRVVYNGTPKARSAAANNDGLNPNNYIFEITNGTGGTPQPVGTRGIVEFPAFGVLAAGEVGIDVMTDRPLVVGLAYTVTVETRVQATNGDQMGYPYTAPFVGASRPTRKRQVRSTRGLIDFASGPDGLIVVAGDIATVTDIESTRLRCMRRTMTVKNTFAHLPGYGIGFDPKAPLAANRLNGLKSDLAQQLGSEPDVEAVATSVALNAARGILTIDERVRTKRGQTFTLQATS